jgi:nitrate/TMAO reductase-like tetraheme cytochrome c subunit
MKRSWNDEQLTNAVKSGTSIAEVLKQLNFLPIGSNYNWIKKHIKRLNLSTTHFVPYKGNFGKTCQECHTEKNWRSTKDFHKNFTLSGLHYTLECSECHKDGKKLAGLSQQCIACHQKDDVHNGSQPNCKNCHTQHFWEVTSFRHSLTKFPLRGAHRVIECTDCHNNGIYKGLSSSCVSCHLTDFNANPAIQHAIKKLLCAGQRGSKNEYQDVVEAAKSIDRWLDMKREDINKNEK